MMKEFMSVASVRVAELEDLFVDMKARVSSAILTILILILNLVSTQSLRIFIILIIILKSGHKCGLFLTGEESIST